ncbi:MAG: hypothetical protein B7X58_15305 [Marinobacter sp. 34-60-7]|nr:MAG: hypothetical protein B7X58_15305 [Marinobacter sp. 34-60-7]
MSGGGERLCVRLLKTGDNTEYVARELATLAGCRASDIGFCGLKDRHAVTVQWFSLYRPGQFSEDTDLLAAIAERWPVLAARREPRKLRRGDHRANGFVVTLRHVTAERSLVEQGLIRLRDQGAPNYFGPQRFGREGGNLQAAVTLDPSRLNRKRGRGGRSASKNVLYFSAARSWLFNEVLAERVLSGTWAEVLPGEPEASSPRSPTGPLWGDGGTLAGEPLAQKNALALLSALADAGYSVSLETSGALDVSGVDARVSRIVDIKPPGSGEVARNRWDNLAHLNRHDEIKFVLADRADYEWARAVLNDRALTETCPVLFSPVQNELLPAQLAEWILADRLPVRMQIQLHKVLWGNTPGK